MSTHLHIARDRDVSPLRLSQERPIQVLLADDHAFMRRSLRLLLEGQVGVAVVAEAADLRTVTRYVHEQLPDVLVLDLQMPDGSSIDTIRRLREQVPGTAIVVSTMEDTHVFAQQTLDAGAIGFVLKAFADVELPEAVRRAAQGEEYVSPRLADQPESLSQTVDDGELTARETEILRLISLGHTSAEIASKLELSRRTIETHRAHIHHKLGLATRAQLVRYALRRGLLTA